MQLVKYINNSGHCSRRDAEKLIQNGEISVNDSVVKDISYPLKNDDKVFHEGEEIKMKVNGANIYLYSKPLGVISSHSDPVHKNTIFSNINIPTKDHLVTVGRLDINSEGLIIVTNNKQLAHHMEKSNLDRVYKVRVHGNMTKLINNKESSITFEDIIYKDFDIYIPKQQQEASNNWIYVTLTGGKNNEIRKIMSFFGLEVNRLIRIQYGPFKLQNLKSNEIQYVKYSQTMLENFIRKISGEKGDFRPRSNDRRDGDRRGGGDRARFGDRPPRRDGDRPSFGDRARSSDRRDRDRRGGGDRARFGDRAPRRDGDRPSFGDRARSSDRRDGDRRGGGDRARFGDRPLRRDGDQPRSGADRRRNQFSAGDRSRGTKPSAFNKSDRRPLADKAPGSVGEKKSSSGENKSVE